MGREVKVSAFTFLPGAGGRADFWRPVAERLADLGPARLLGYPGFAGVPADPGVASLDGIMPWLLARMAPGPSHLVAQSMGGVLAIRLALEAPERVSSLVLVATSGGVDVAALGGTDWRPDYRRELPGVPDWFAADRTDLSARLGELRVPTLLLHSDADPICPPKVAEHLASHIAGARRICVRGGTHMFGEERPDEVAQAIRDHLERCGRSELHPG
jgi:pimeloyl-ACP methyl ester carboxylesterase